MLRVTVYPLLVYEGVGGTDIVRIVTHRHLGMLDLRVAERITPVENIVDLHAVTGRHLRRPPRVGRPRKHQELFVIRDQSLRPPTGTRQTHGKSLTRALPERRMIHRIIDLISELAETKV